MNTKSSPSSSSSVQKSIDGRDRSDYSNANLQASIQRSSLSPVPSVTVNRTVRAPLNSEHSEFLMDNSKLFYQKLREVHESYGLGLVASVAGAVLDLFHLYKEVTFRGGFAMVTKHSRWSEVASAVNFISKVSEPCFQLQEIYYSLLYRFELIYYFGTPERQDVPPGPTLSSSLVGKTSNCQPSSSTDCPTVKKNLQTNPWQSPTVMIDSEKRNGVIREIKDSTREQVTTVPSLINNAGLKNTTESDPVGMQVRVAPAKGDQAVGSRIEKEAKIKPTVGSSGKGTKKKDPEAPTRTRTAYHFFLCKQCDLLKKIHVGPDLRKRVIDLWKNLSDSDKLPYIEESRKDKERFDREIAAYKERQNMQSSKRECKSHNPEPSVGIYNVHQNMQIGRGMISNSESSSVGMVAYEEHQTMETGKALSKLHNPEPNVVVYKEHQNMKFGGARGMIPNSDCSRVEDVSYEEHQDTLIGEPLFEIDNPEPSRLEILNPEPSRVEMVAYKEHQCMQVDMEHNSIHNPFPSEVERAAYGVHQNMHIGSGELSTSNPNPSLWDESHATLQTEESDNARGHDEYHVSLQMEELDKLRNPDQSMVELAVELMENAEKLDASLQIHLGDFLSVL